MTSYGIDSALSQILFFHHTNTQNYFTCSKKRLDEAISLYTPNIVCGFNIDPDYYKSVSNIHIINRSNSSSTTNQLATYLNVDRTLFKYGILADKLLSRSEETEVVYNYYDAVGHDQFVNRFISTDSLTMTKTEQSLGKLYVIEHQKLAKDYIDNFCYYKNDIAICRSNFRLSKYIEEMLIDSYAESGLKLIVTYQFNYTGKDIVCNIRTKKDLLNTFMEAVPISDKSDEYDNSVIVKLDQFDNIEEQVYDKISNICDNAIEIEKRKAYDKYDKMIQN